MTLNKEACSLRSYYQAVGLLGLWRELSDTEEAEQRDRRKKKDYDYNGLFPLVFLTLVFSLEKSRLIFAITCSTQLSSSQTTNRLDL